jgi:hypothetical protein
LRSHRPSRGPLVFHDWFPNPTSRNFSSGTNAGRLTGQNVIFYLQKGLFYGLIRKKFYQDDDMFLKAKASSPTDLPSWVDSRQEQGLYFFSREAAIQTLHFTDEAFKKSAARLTKKNRVLRIRSGFFITCLLTIYSRFNWPMSQTSI